MPRLRLALSPRFATLGLAGLLALLCLVCVLTAGGWFWLLAFLLFAGLTALGCHDLWQTKHAVLRNYPITAHLRFLLESIRPEMRQYFFEDEKNGTPFSRDKRALVYQRAKLQLDKRPFGTQYEVTDTGFEWLTHSIVAPPRPDFAPPPRARS